MEKDKKNLNEDIKQNPEQEEVNETMSSNNR